MLMANSTDSTYLLNRQTSVNSLTCPTITIDTCGIETKQYKRRWFILIIFSLASMAQNFVWNTWGPISASAKAVFGWSDFEISMFPNWGTICFVIFVIPITWLINTKGLRISCLLATFSVALASILRCLTSSSVAATWLINIAQILNGIIGPVIASTPSALSAVWFAEYERTIATAIAVSSVSLGVATSFLIGPLMVSQPNETTLANFSNSSDFFVERNEIMNLMYVECGIAVGIFLLFLIYFPEKPPKPPTISASIPRYDFKDGFNKLMRNPQFWMISISLGIYNGVYYGCMAILTTFLETRQFTQPESGWLGFYSLITGLGATLIISWFIDRLNKKMKLTIVLLKIINLGSIIWFMLLWKNVIPFSKESIYIAYIIISISNFSTVPIYYELAIESMYPINEGVITGVLNMFINAIMSIFLFIQMFLSKNDIDQDWIIWCLLSSVLISLPLVMLFKGLYSRLTMDKDFRKNIQHDIQSK